MRKTLAALLLAMSFASPAIAAPCGPIPALPDTERRTEYTGVSASTGPFNINFQLYGDSTDYSAWLAVWVNGVLKTAVTDYTVATASGPAIGSACLPITNAQVTFLAAQTGTIEIVGARRPRRASQVSESGGVTAHAFNQVISDMTAALRERWDRESRLLRVPPGDTLSVLPPAATRASTILGFDAGGNPSLVAPTIGLGNVVGPSSSIDGHVAVFDGLTGTKIKDGGPAVGTATSVGLALPSIITVTGSPVTTAGTLTGTLATQTANTIFAGPNTGGAAQPTFRALVAADIPAAIYANPSALVGPAAVNGAAATAMRSDSAPAINLTSAYKWTGDHYFGSGRPWCDVRANGATGNGITDDTTAINACITSLTALGSGILYFPTGSYCTFSGLTINTSILIFGENQNTEINACGHDVTVVTLNQVNTSIKNIALLGYNSVSTTKPVVDAKLAAAACVLEDVTIRYGTYAFVNETGDCDLHRVNATQAYVALVNNTFGATYLRRSKLDQQFPVSTPARSTAFNAWTNAHGYTAGDIASTAGYYIQATTNCTSAAGAPTVVAYNASITDNTCTWKLVAPTTYSAVLASTGSSNTYLSDFTDMTGPFNIGLSIVGTAQSVTCENCIFGSNLTAGINAAAGTAGLIVSGSQLNNCIFSGCVAIQLTGARDTTITNNLMIADDRGVNVTTASTNTIVAGNQIYGAIIGILFDANLTKFNITGNSAGLSAEWGATQTCIQVIAGTSDFYNIVGNNCAGATSATVVDGGTGVNKFVQTQGPLAVGSGGTGAATVSGATAALLTSAFQTAPITVNFGSAGDNAIPIMLPTGYTQIRPQGFMISQCTATLATGTFGVFTTTGGGGAAIVTAGAVSSITNNTANTANNGQFYNTINNSNSEAYTPAGGNIQFRVGSTVASVCKVTAIYNPMP